MCGGLDLRDVWRPGGGASRLTWRRLGVLIERLPPESAFKTAVRDAQGPMALAEAARNNTGPSESGWGSYSNTDMHLGALIDEIRWITYAIYHAQGAKPKRPRQYPRPGVMPERTRQLTPMGQEYLAELRERRMKLRAAAGRTVETVVPAHIAEAAPTKLGPAERHWISQQLHAMRTRTPPPPPS